MALGKLAIAWSGARARADDREAGQAPPTRPLWTLRVKGIFALSAMIVYVAAFAAYVAHDRRTLLDIVDEQEQVYDRQQALIRVNALVAHSIVELQYLLNHPPGEPAYGDVQIDLRAIEAGLPELQERYAEIVPNVNRFHHAAEAARRTWSIEALTALRDSEQVVSAQIESIEDRLGDRHLFLARQYRDANQHVFIAWIITSSLGIAVFGTLVSVFFTRLAADIKALESRAIAVVGGYRGAPLRVNRRDELGGLMLAVNRMQSELRRWEQQQEMSRQQRFHQEKMAAVGSLAAAVAHEVNNPIAAIAGIAQHLIEAERPSGAATVGSSHPARLILTHAERIASIMRQVAGLTARHSADPEPIDLNSLVDTTCNFLTYDKRFHGIDLVTALAPGIPAVTAVADHLTQVLMNLLINAADAMETVCDRKRTIIVSTAPADSGVELSVRDNGNGMPADVLAHAFEEFFTTKPIERGRGIGLSLCKALMEQNGGRVELESAPGAGTIARCFVPCVAP